MRNIRLKRLEFRNFKGLRNVVIDNFGDVTNIDGDNGTGKSSLFDGFLWLISGKDSADRQDFSIKTFDSLNNVIHKLEHEVIGDFIVDGEEINLKRIYKEKWQKKKGSEVAELTGHTTEYYYNEVPLSTEKEWKSKIENLFPDKVFKLITNPLYFNSLKWQDRREILIAMAGEVSNEEVAGDNDTYKKLVELLSNKTAEEFKKEIAAKKSKIKQELETIPTRIDEADRSKPELLNEEAIQIAINGAKSKLEKLDDEISDISKGQAAEYEKNKKLHDEKHELELSLQSKLNALKVEARGDLDNLILEKSNLIKRVESIKYDIQDSENKIASYERTITSNLERMAEYRTKWAEINNETLNIDPSKDNCAVCLQKLPDDKIAEIKASAVANFNADKSKRMGDINSKGMALKAENEALEDYKKKREDTLKSDKLTLDTLKVKIEDLSAKIEALESVQSNIVETDEIKALKEKIANFVIPSVVAVDIEEQKAERVRLNNEILNLTSSLGNKAVVDNINKRIEELKEQEKNFAQELAKLEKQEFIIDSFNKEKINRIEKKVNSMFMYVSFKMFETQINGAEVECCNCIVNGVPYSDVNTAGKINAGLDIINALTEHFQISAPIWIDNKESTNTLIPTKSQIITLTVSNNKSLNF